MTDDTRSLHSGLLQILANGAQTNADFAGIGTIPEAYYKGRDERFKNDFRDKLQAGLPKGPDGQVDWGKASELFAGGGQLEPSLKAGELGLAQQKQQYGQSQDAINNPPPGGPQQPPLVNAPSTNRSAMTPHAAPLNKGGAQNSPQGGQGGAATLVQILTAQDIPNDQISAASERLAAQLDLPDPNAQINIHDPKIRNVLVPAIQQMKRGGIGQVQPPQPGDNPPQGQPQAAQPGPQVVQAPPQAAPQVAQAQPPPQNVPPRPQFAPQSGPTDPRFVGLVPAGRSPEMQVHLLQRAIDSGSLPPEQAKSYQTSIDAIRAAAAPKEPTTEMKNAAASGQTLSQYQEKQGELAATQAGEVERAKSYVEKYNVINAAGDNAVNEIPKLHLALKQLDNPNYYGGPFNAKNLAGKRIVAALGGDPDKAAPQEIVAKITADSVLNGMGSLKGLGPIRVAEMKLLSQATMSPDNSIEAQKFLASMAIRVQERAAHVSDLAQNYNEGVLDNGFDKKIRADDRAHPLFSQSEIDRFQNIFQGKESQSDPYVKARAAIKAGAPQDAVMQRLKDHGHDPGKL